jgi:hypothetical protein
MTYTPENLERWNSADPAFGSRDNYAGPDLSAFYVAPISNGRDTSDAVTLSNWRVISAELETLAKHDESGAARFGHWAVGWYELWLIHESDSAALKCADEWAVALANYCVADESDLSKLEMEEEGDAWDSWAGREWRGAVEKALQQYGPEYYCPYWADEILEKLPGEADFFYDLWHEISQHLNWTVEHHSDGPSFNFSGAAELLTVDVLAKLTGLPLLSFDQEWRRESYPWPGSEPAPLVLSLPVEG